MFRNRDARLTSRGMKELITATAVTYLYHWHIYSLAHTRTVERRTSAASQYISQTHDSASCSVATSRIVSRSRLPGHSQIDGVGCCPSISSDSCLVATESRISANLARLNRSNDGPQYWPQSIAHLPRSHRASGQERHVKELGLRKCRGYSADDTHAARREDRPARSPNERVVRSKQPNRQALCIARSRLVILQILLDWDISHTIVVLRSRRTSFRSSVTNALGPSAGTPWKDPVGPFAPRRGGAQDT